MNRYDLISKVYHEAPSDPPPPAPTSEPVEVVCSTGPSAYDFFQAGLMQKRAMEREGQAFNDRIAAKKQAEQDTATLMSAVVAAALIWRAS